MAATSACSAAGRQSWISADRRAAGDVRARRRNLPARSAALLPPLRGSPYLGLLLGFAACARSVCCLRALRGVAPAAPRLTVPRFAACGFAACGFAACRTAACGTSDGTSGRSPTRDRWFGTKRVAALRSVGARSGAETSSCTRTPVTRGRVALFTDGAPIRVLSPELEVIAEVPIDHTRAVSGAGGDRRGADRSRCRSII